MALNYPISADTKADMKAVVLPDSWVYMLMGSSTAGDQPPVFYRYNSSSTATDDNDSVITPTALIGGPGRYLKTKLSYNDLINMLSLAAVAASGAYSDLTGKPTLATVATSGNYNDLISKPTIPSSQQAYEGTTLRSNSFPIIKSATVASGVAVFHLTNDGLSTGTSLFPNGVIQDSINLYVNDSTAAYQMSFAFTNSNKTVTVTANKLTTANILTGILGQAAANGAVIKLQIWGY